VADDHADAPGARCPRALDEPGAAERPELRAHHARRLHPPGQSDEHDEQRHRRLEYDRGDHQQRKAGNREHAVADAHQHGIERAARIAGAAADRDAADAGDRRRQEPHRQRHPRAVQDPRQDVAPEIVGAERVRRRWRFAAAIEVDALGRVRRDRRRSDGAGE
jgi:hypothetical protein